MSVERDTAPWFSLPQNLVLMAGAGAGKTHGLITLALHVLAGARPDGEPVPPAKLVAVTFTEKAAAEMKLRLRARVRALADGEAKEPELFATFAQLGLAPPKQAFWEELYANLANAFVGTFHSYCAQLLRRYPAEASLDPGFGLLEETEADELFVRCAEDRVLRSLEASGPEREEARRLVKAVGFKGQGDHGAALLELLRNVHLKLAEDGRSPESLPEPRPETSFVTARDGVVALMRDVCALAPGTGADPVLAACRDLVDDVAHANLGDAARLLPRVKELCAGINLTRCGKVAKPLLKELRDERCQAFLLACGDAIAAPLHKDFLRLLGRTEEAYRAEKERRGALDFSDLVRAARDLLRDAPAVREEVQGKVSVLLVDECQDTNRLQLDLVALLCEQRGGPRRVVKGELFAQLPLEPAMLACVGDKKQSIYEFRGADVSVIVEVARRMEQGDGRVEYLQHNRRSRPALLTFFNRLFAAVMRPNSEGDPSWRVPYVAAQDDLSPWRPAGPEGACVRLLPVEGEDADGKREAEARAVASHIAWLLSPAAPPVVGVDREGATLRRAEGKDVAILLRRFTHLDLFRRELLARSIPHVVVNGGGFFGAQEVLDLTSLLALLADPDDRLALCAVLRSPLVALTDGALAALALEKQLSLSGLERGLGPAASPGERERLAAFLACWSEVAPIAHRLGVAAVLEAVCDALDLEAVLAAGFEGEQKVANVRKLVAWAKRERPAGPGAAARRLMALCAQESREGQAALVEDADPTAVRLMTVHQSKGLEFPVVYVPECGARGRRETDAVLFDRREGLCVRPRGEDGEVVATSAAGAVTAALHSRQAAESERLFYVAATRARDLLVFSGENGRGGSAAWRTHLDRFVSEDEGAKALMDLAPAPDVAPTALDGLELQRARPPVAEGAPEPAALLERTAGPAQLAVRSLSAPVTQLSTFSSCPRRHYLTHVVGLQEERPFEHADEPMEPALGELSASDRGSFVHLALERLDFGRPAREQVRALMAAEGLAAEGDAAEALVEDVAAFAESPLGRSFGKLPATRLHRELPFVLSVSDRVEAGKGAGPGLTLQLRGTIDVLAVLDEGYALILDYKHTRAKGRGADAYAFQLACYALAMRAVLPKEVAIRTGIAFLQDRGMPADVRELPEAALEGFRQKLLGMGREMLERRRRGDYPVLARSRCQKMHCGFVYHCHGERPTKQLTLGLAD